MASAAELIGQLKTLDSQRAPWLTLWDDCLRFCLPQEGSALGVNNDGQERPAPVDGTGIRSLRILAAGLYSMTYNSGDKFFDLRPSDAALAESDESKRWFGDLRDAVLRYFQNSSLSSTYHSAAEKFCALGVPVVFVEFDGRQLVFKEFSIVDCRLAESASGLVDTCFRTFEYSARQILEEFGKEGDNVHQSVRDAAKSDPYRKFHLLHAVYPRQDYDPDKATKENKAFASCYVDLDNQSIIRESGFDTFPYLAPRFYKHSREVYGRSPAMDALPDLRMVNRACADYIDAQEMAINPVTYVADEEVAASIQTKRQPGAVIPFDPSRPPIFQPMAARLDYIIEFIQRYQDSIERHFFADLFLAMEQVEGQTTATEVRERVAEKIQSITPVCARLKAEFWQPLISRVVGLLLAAGVVAPPPPELADAEYDVVFATKLDAKIKVVEGQALLRTISATTQIAQAQQVTPAIALLFDLQVIARHMAESEGVPSDLIRSAAEVQRLSEELAKAQAAQDAQLAAQSMVKPVDTQRAAEPGSVLNPGKQAAA